MAKKPMPMKNAAQMKMKMNMKKKPQQSGSLMLLGMVALFASIILLLVSMASLLLVFFGMLPTLVSVLIDRSPQRFAFISVLAMNFAGVFPFLLELWLGSNSMSAATDILTNVFSLFTMYGLAALGWILFLITPPLVSTVMAFVAQKRIANLRAKQKKLIAEWGNAVSMSDEDMMMEEENMMKKDAEPMAPKR